MRVLPTLAYSLLACCGLLASGLAAAPAAAASPVHCSEFDLPVSVPTPREVIRGQLCLPAGRPPTTVQLLVHGGVYNRVYWDFPYQPERYSYQRDMARHGYATFAMDQLGSGQSTKPHSVALLSPRVIAESIHQVIGHLRAGRVGGMRFDRVILVGHSVGSVVVMLEAGNYHDVDGVILTGLTHMLSTPIVARGFAIDTYPVTLDPQLRKTGSDPGYTTTKPGRREPLFYVTSNADPLVIATDEATKDQVPALTVGLELTLSLGPASRDIDVPVLLAVGEKDALFCGFLARDCSSAEALQKQEAPFFSPAAQLSTFVLPGSGHSIALHNNTNNYREATRAWLAARTRFGT